MAESPLHLLVARSSATVIEVAETFPPYTTPSLTANLVCRVSLAIIANLVCLVPLRLLYRNGELAAVIFILSVEIKNLETIVNAFIWRNDDVSSWWAGYGWCDFDNHLHNIVIGFFVTCLLAIVRNLAHQVGLMRANALTAKEKQRRNWIQALIIFPFPIIQLALTHPVTAQRYIVGSLMGCDWVAHNSWPFLVFFVLPPPIFAFVTAAYAILIYKRFRQVHKTTEMALYSNRVAQQRSQRTRRKLYLMVISILVPFLPIVIALSVLNILAMGGIEPYNYDKIHNHAEPFEWNTILLIPSSQINWVVMNNCYISIATAVPIFVFFGMTKDAINTYRHITLWLGLGALFPGLRIEYNPDKTALSSAGTFGSSQLQPVASLQSKPEVQLVPDPSMCLENPRTGHHQPDWPDAEVSVGSEPTVRRSNLPVHNPFRTRFHISAPAFLRRWSRTEKVQEGTDSGSCLGLVDTSSSVTKTHVPTDSCRGNIQTLVWHEHDDFSSQSEPSHVARKPVPGGVEIQTVVRQQSETGSIRSAG